MITSRKKVAHRIGPTLSASEQEQEIGADVLVIGGGIAGCWAAISAARQGVKVALVEKGDTVRSGAGGPGCDHWCNAPANPLSNVDPDEWAVHMADRPYSNGIGIQIQCREDWDTLLEMEQMGGKIRDTEGEYKGAEGRDEKSKLMISPRYARIHSYVPDDLTHLDPPATRNNVVIRVWGSTFKPALKKECLRLGVKIFDRVMVTGLLTEDGVGGGRVVGATGFNNRTGEFMIFKSKAAIHRDGGRRFDVADEHGAVRLLEHDVPHHLGRRHRHGLEGGRRADEDGGHDTDAHCDRSQAQVVHRGRRCQLRECAHRGRERQETPLSDSRVGGFGVHGAEARGRGCDQARAS